MGRVSRCMVVILHMADNPHKAATMEQRASNVSAARFGGPASLADLETCSRAHERHSTFFLSQGDPLLVNNSG